MLKVRFSSYKPLLQKKSTHLVEGGVLHVLLPIFNVRITLMNQQMTIDHDDFQRISDNTPFIADLKPSGKFLMEDIHNIFADNQQQFCH